VLYDLAGQAVLQMPPHKVFRSITTYQSGKPEPVFPTVALQS